MRSNAPRHRRAPRAWLAAAVIGLACPLAMAAPITVQLQQFLVVATGDRAANESNDFEAFDFDGGELGADQEVVSSGSGGAPTQKVRSYTSIGIDLTGTFVAEDGKTPFNSDNRWTDADPDFVDGDNVGIPDFLPGARPLVEPPDQSGNVAITGRDAGFTSENADYHADLGIKCANDPGDCYFSDDKDNSWFETTASTGVDLGTGSGVSSYDPVPLQGELDAWKLFIDALGTEDTLGSDLVNINYKDAAGPFVTDLDAIDVNNDGFAVIDIDRGHEGVFNVNNTDWILSSTRNTIAIFRMTRNGSYDFANSSIMLGPGCTDATGAPLSTLGPCTDDPVTELGAIFYAGLQSTANNQIFNLDNVILGGVALWDLDGVRDTKITINNGQGCTQLISDRVELSSKNRYNRCSIAFTDVPEPATLALLVFALAGVAATRVSPRPR